MPDFIPPRRAGPPSAHRRSINPPTIETVPFGGAMGDGPETPGQTVPPYAGDGAQEHWLRLSRSVPERRRMIRALSVAS